VNFSEGVMDGLYALVLAGGRGTRFWPVSRRALPKQCVALGGEAAMLVQTIERLLPIIPIDRILVATGREMEASVRALLPSLPSANVIVEPWGRNTAPCIGLGAVEIGRRAVGAMMAVFPSDHRVDDVAAFQSAVIGAAQAAKSTNALVTLGLKPTHPETGFGYLELGRVVGEWHGHALHQVERFVEKPGPEMAQHFVEGGRHLWNAGMFVFGVDTIRDAFRAHLPKTHEALERIANHPDALAAEWGNMDAISIDYGIMERSRHVLTVPVDMGWNDMGTWKAAGAAMPRVSGGRGHAYSVTSRDTSGCVVHAPGKTVVLLGVSDLVVVDTEDALLVMESSRSAQLGEVVRELEADGKVELL